MYEDSNLHLDLRKRKPLLGLEFTQKMQKCIESKELEVHKLDPSFVLTDKLRALGTQDGINGLKVPRISGRLMTKNQFPHLFLSHWMLFPPTAFFRLVDSSANFKLASSPKEGKGELFYVSKKKVEKRSR